MSSVTFDISVINNDFFVVQNNVDFDVQNTTIELEVTPMGTKGVDGAKGDKGDQGEPGLSNINTIYGEQPAGLINGSNATFTTASNFQPGKIALYLNGLLQKIVLDYQTVGTQTIILSNSPQVGEQITVSYITI